MGWDFMDNKAEFKGQKVIAAITAASIIFVTAVAPFAAAALIKSGFSTPAGLAALCSCFALLIVSLYALFSKLNKDYLFRLALEENTADIGYIKYDSKKRSALLSGDVAALTGIDIDITKVISEEDYLSFMEEIKAELYPYEHGIYVSRCPERWLKLSTFTVQTVECTVIKDVSDYVKSINLIRSLRYCDSVTGLLTKEAFAHKIRQVGENSAGTLGVIHFVVMGVDKVLSFLGAASADRAVLTIASFIKTYENPHNTFVGRTTGNEFSVAISDTYRDGCRKIAEKIHAGVLNLIEKMPEEEKIHIKAYCGYAISEQTKEGIGALTGLADFAAFDAVRQKSYSPVEYDAASYASSAHEFKKIQVFNEIIEKSLIDFHFQPVVNARTGEIYGYEALMRPQSVEDVRLTPLELLSIAKSQNKLELIENYTFFNALKILSENQDFFSGRKLFINSISSVSLSNAEYETLYNSYGELFSKVVIEITEFDKINKETIDLLDVRFKKHNAQIALDDYGAGYSNESTLLSVMPDYIKIDRSMTAGIDSDFNKQQLVSNIINFSSLHGIKSLAEGVETTEELETVIFLGIDLIQGFVACKAVSILMLDIPTDVRSVIVNYNLKHKGRGDRVYEVTNESPVDLVSLSVFGYTNIVVKAESCILTGDKETAVNMRIICEDNSSSTIYLKNVNLKSTELPIMEIGRNSIVRLVIEGDNYMSVQGIRVPSSARFLLSGDGNLSINCAVPDGVCIGGNSKEDFGEIILESTGLVDLSHQGDYCISIGGGTGAADSLINIVSGRFKIVSRGINVTGIGSCGGEVAVKLNNCHIEGDFAGQNVVGIGSASGNVNIDSGADIQLVSSGDLCCGVGTLSGGEGSVRFNGGSTKITVNAKKIAGIGALGGNVEVALIFGVIDIKCEGKCAVCVGDPDGYGYVRLGNVVLSASSKSGNDSNIMVNNGVVVINSGNIFTNSIRPIEAFGPFGSKLVLYHVENPGKAYKASVKENGEIYQYNSETSGLFEGCYVYLPEGYENEMVKRI